MKIFEHFQQNKITPKMTTYCRHSKFQSNVEKNHCAGHQKNNVRCLSRFIASMSRTVSFVYLLDGKILKLGMPAMGRRPKF